jgi:RHS repeat-associated protein
VLDPKLLVSSGSSMQLGNGKWESTQFNSRLEPTQIALGTVQSGTDKLKLNFNYGGGTNNGNVLSQTITVPTTGAANGFTAVQNYSYDSLNRLKSAVENIDGNQTPSWKQTFTFDRYGNRNFDTANTTTIPTGCAVAVCNPQVDPATNKLIGYQFDNSGNTKVDAQGRTFTYDAENKQTKVVSGGITVGEYFYDGDGRRVKKVSAAETTIFVYDASGKMVAEYSTNVAPTSTAHVSYLTNDHLGSPRITTDKDGKVFSRRDFMPFGEEIQSGTGGRTTAQGYGGQDSIRQKFTGYERDNESELDFAQARYYSSKLGRFYSVDPENYGASEDDPQSWNGYGYGRNNPILYTDSEGLDYLICDRNGENCVTQSDEVVKAAQQKLGGLFQETGRDGDYDSGNILNDDGTPLGTYERVTIDPAYQLVYSTSDQAMRKAKVVGVAAGGAALIGACIGTGACAAIAAASVPILKKVLGRVRLSDLFKGGKAKASDLVKYAEQQGWKRTKTPNGPIKYKDANGVDRITIKSGSSRTPGSNNPHVELKDAGGKRIDPSGNPVNRKSVENHTPIDYDL